jgi:hypothetical protein
MAKARTTKAARALAKKQGKKPVGKPKPSAKKKPTVRPLHSAFCTAPCVSTFRMLMSIPSFVCCSQDKKPPVEAEPPVEEEPEVCVQRLTHRPTFARGARSCVPALRMLLSLTSSVCRCESLPAMHQGGYAGGVGDVRSDTHTCVPGGSPQGPALSLPSAYPQPTLSLPSSLQVAALWPLLPAWTSVSPKPRWRCTHDAPSPWPEATCPGCGDRCVACPNCGKTFCIDSGCPEYTGWEDEWRVGLAKGPAASPPPSPGQGGEEVDVEAECPVCEDIAGPYVLVDLQRAMVSCRDVCATCRLRPSSRPEVFVHRDEVLEWVMSVARTRRLLRECLRLREARRGF